MSTDADRAAVPEPPAAPPRPAAPPHPSAPPLPAAPPPPAAAPTAAAAAAAGAAAGPESAPAEPGSGPGREPGSGTGREPGSGTQRTATFVPVQRPAAPATSPTGLPPAPRGPARPRPTLPAVRFGHSPLTVRSLAVAVCLVLGVGLLGGAAAGTLLSGDEAARHTVAAGFDGARAAWHEIPVDDLFPRTLDGKGAGPGGADRRWTRVAVAPDSGCAHAFDPLLAKALTPVGCARLVRATYADETSSSVTTVGLMFTEADPAAMRDLRQRFAAQNLGQRTDLMPRPYAARGTVAADFGDAQRASWTVHVLRDAPVVVYSVSGFADGRVVTDPQSANDATRKAETSAAAQAGLGHEAQGIADRIERRLREATVRRESGDADTEAKGGRGTEDRDRAGQDAAGGHAGGHAGGRDDGDGEGGSR
ncbi:hypothetical protein [Streptomyces qinglanensis]|uniref:Uncharacterized protein n=1 Tax=Streptomyces qinglanensis TaxID=943816 RepID=A0A1H9SW85_9ACTN|nr:hypothetical protein [Streptomyces qinglanensis]SER88659.1 hypothetical protein SAMN05421870_105112 [Streptomyces qinglanensis]